MSIQAAWDNDSKTIVSLTYHQPWNWEELEVATVQINALLDSVNCPVDVIIDVREGGQPPSGALDRFRKALRNDHPNIRHVIFVGNKDVVTGFLEIIFRVYGRLSPTSRLRFVNSIEEARTLAAQERDGLPGAQN
jgi:hypothetical protein